MKQSPWKMATKQGEQSAETKLGWQFLRLSRLWVGMMLLAVLIAVAIAELSMHPPAVHIMQLTAYLSACGIVALLVGALAHSVATLPRLSNVRLQLAIPSALATVVIAITTVFLAHGMFISGGDSVLLLIFLAFSAIVALSLSGTLAAELGGSIARIEQGARRVAEGDYSHRIAPADVGAARELRQLARWFNMMAAHVEDAFARRDIAETERRQVIASLSHDLRTPLASTRAMLEAIDDGVVTDAETVTRYQRLMRAELVRLSILMDELFDLARLDAGAVPLVRESLPLEDLLSDAVEAMRERAERAGVRVIGQVEPSLPPVCVDASQLYRTLSNLLQNAIQHTSHGGAVLVRALARPEVGLENELLVQVIDTGEGIATGDLPHVFERTYRGEASRQRHSGGGPAQEAELPGAGLGLAIARGIIELHGGAIWATSPLPAELRALAGVPLDEATTGESHTPGTVFSFTLPRNLDATEEM